MIARRRLRTVLWSTLIAAFLLLPLVAGAQQVKGRGDNLDDLAFALPETRVAAQPEDVTRLEGALPAALAADWEAFRAREGAGWRLVLDRVSGRPALIEGGGLAWIPGSANHLTGRDLGLSRATSGRDVPPEVVAARAFDFLRAYPGLFNVAVRDLTPLAVGPLGDDLYVADFRWSYRGIEVENAHVVFRLNHGNLVQAGQEFVSDSIERLDPSPSIGPETAWQILRGYLGKGTEMDQVLEPGRLLVVPVRASESLAGAGPDATGLAYRLVWVLAFRRPGVLGTWEARVDAHGGEVVSFQDANLYGRVHGGVYVGDRPTPEVDRPFPYADLGGGSFADSAGRFAGTSGTSTLAGQYVHVVDNCGAVSLTASGGDLDFGSGAGKDCATPGAGGAGNTHAARTQYYNVNIVKLKAMTYMPANTWLQATLTDVVNINQICNAYWDILTGTVNFFRSGGICDNTGELPGVSLHEFAHGLDYNDGNGASPDKGTGETYGDFTAALQTHDSCGGAGFFSNGMKCSGYGDPCTSCSGVRDIDFAKHSSGLPAVPTMLNGSTGFRCNLDSGYPGPCGYEGHCESYISSEAMWDLVNRDLTAAPLTMDVTTAWQLVDRLWYLTRSTATAAYACPSLATTSGCGAGNLYSVLRWADDCDGDLANGTPHAAAIFAAMNRHGIACGIASDATNQNQADCPCSAPSSPTLAATPGNDSVSLAWSDTGAAKYAVFRNENSCDAGFTKVGESTGLSYSDAAAANDVTYFYRVQAYGSSEGCASPMSNCATVMPVTCQGSITLDKAVYNCDDAVQITLKDLDLLGLGTRQVSVFSTVEPAPETLSLGESPANSGRFTGSIQTTTSAAGGDGKIGVADGSTITVEYVDASACGTPNVTVDRTATTDCAGPVISGVLATTTDVSATVTWTTGEQANSRVTWGTSVPPGTPAENLADYVTSHSITISGLANCTTYYFTVTSTDGAGNSATSDNGGVYYSFRTKGPSYLLGPESFESGDGGWTPVNVQGSPWIRSTCRKHSGSYSFKVGAADCGGSYLANTNSSLVSPSIDLGASGHGYHLRFWEWGKTEVDGYGTLRDKCHVQVSTDGGTSYGDVIPAYGGDSQGWQFTDVDLAAYSGAVKLRFWFEADYDWNYEGWYVDDVEVSRLITCNPDLRYDGKAVQDFCSGGGAGSGNGTLDGGEDAVLSVTLYNQGPTTATGVTGTLSTTTPNVTVTGAAASFQDIPSMGSGGSNAPHFSFFVGAGVPCGTAINFTLHVASNEIPSGWNIPVTVTTGAQAPGSPVTVLTENFNTSGGTGWPTGWTRTPTSGTGQYWRVPSYEVYNCDGNTSNLNMQVDSSSSNNANAWSFTPAQSLTSGVTYTLTFDQRTGGCGTVYDPGGTLEVLCNTSASSTGGTSLQTWTGLTNTTCTQRSITFTVPSTGTYYLCFHYTRTASLSSCGMNVDNVLVTYRPVVCTQTACAPASGLTAMTSASPVYAVRPATVAFTGLAHGGTAPYGYAWSFGEGGSSSQQSPSYTYNSAGTYTAALTVTDGASGSSTDNHLSIRVVDPLTASAAADTTSGSYPLAVNFTGTPSGGSGVYTYDWDFGDGTAHATGQNPSHTYNGCGDFTVTFRVTDDHGATATDGHLGIHVAGPVQAAAAVDCPGGPRPFTVHLTGAGSCGTPPYAYDWDFGDGTPHSSAQNPAHTYTTSGTFTVTLTVTDATMGTAADTHLSLPIGTSATVFTENFDSATKPALPAGWSSVIVNGASPAWATGPASTTHPSGVTAHTAPNLAYFNSYNTGTGTKARLQRTVGLSLACYSGKLASLNFWMYHDTGSTAADTVQPQYSTDGGATWTNAGAAVGRNDGSSGWKSHTADISAAAGQADVRIAFLGTSSYGNDCHIDDVAVAVSTPAPNLVYQSRVITADVCAAGGAGHGNGIAEPGEDVSLNVTIKNTGTQDAAGATATLATTTPGVTVTTATASFGTVAVGATANSATPYVIRIDPSVACSSTVSFTLTMASGTDTWPGSFTLPVGLPAAQLTQNFDGVTAPAMPAGWSSAVVASSTTPTVWVTNAGTHIPSGTASHSTPNLVYMNSGSSGTSGGSSRLAYGSALNFGPYGAGDTVSLSFWMYHDTGYSTYNDRVQVQVSTTGPTGTWTNVGSAVSRYAATAAWTQHAVDLSAYKGQAAVWIGILGTSAYGNDLHLDDIAVTANRAVCTVCPACEITSCTAGADTASGTAPLTVNFTGGAVVTCPGGETYGWIFGDGGTSAQQNPSHTFTAAGTYAVTMNITDAHGNSCSDNHLSIEVSGGVPPETAGTPGTAMQWAGGGKSSLAWGANSAATNYKVYRGTPEQLAGLANSDLDSCLRATTTDPTTGEILTENPADGSFIWYLVTGANASGEGTAGDGSSGPRVLNSTGGCP